MSRTARKYSAAASLILASAILNMLIAALDFSSSGLPMIGAAVLWTLFGLGLVQTWRWCAHLAFLVMLCGVPIALAGALGSSGAVAVLFCLIVLTDSMAALILFGVLWSDPQPAHVA